MSKSQPRFGYHRPPTASGSCRADEAIMRLACTTQGSVKRITLAGEVDLSNAHLLVDLVEALVRTRAPQVALDLSRVTFFGAHGVTALVRARHLLADRGGRLTLCDPSPAVRRVLDVTGALTDFEIVGRAVTRFGRTASPAVDRYAPSPPPPRGREVSSCS